MEQPKWDEYMLPELRYLADGEVHSRREIIANAQKALNLDEACLAEKASSGQLLTENRAGWGLTYLKQSGLIESPKHAKFLISAEGKKLLETNPSTFRQADLEKYPKYQEFITRTRPKNTTKEPAKSVPQVEKSPDELINEAQSQIRAIVCSDILAKVRAMSPASFEKLVIDLLTAMGYGDGTPNSGVHTGKSGDGGIDGVINQDKLGLDTIYLQAKRFQEGNNVSAHDVRDFVGALQGKESKGSRKGVFITTSDFTKEGRDYVDGIKDGKVILINGDALAQLMYDYDVGVTVSKTVKIKKVDNDFFED